MSRPRLLATCFVAIYSAATSLADCGRACPGAARTADALVEAVNACVEPDIPLPSADRAACDLDRLPASLGKIVPHVPEAHRRLVAKSVRGRLRVQSGVRGFDLVGRIDDAVDPGRAAVVRDYLAGRAVDVATGSGVSDGPYPFSFDWVVVLDRRSRTLYSFVLNCHD